MAKQTAHSEVGRLTSVLVKRPQAGFVSQDFVNQEWEALNFLGAPDFVQAIDEHKNLEDILSANGELHFLPQADDVTLDSVYCRDASIVTDFGVILCNMGKDKRKNEPEKEKNYFQEIGLDILGTIEEPGTLEGGDVCWLDEKTLAVGHTYRTNYAGIEQLKGFLEPNGVEVLVAEMPHYQGPADVFHLMSVLSPVDIRKTIIYSPLTPIHFRNELIDRGFEFVEVPDEEFDSMGANVLAIAPGECIMVAGNPITKSRLEESGCIVHEYAGSEISVKGGGGPTCLTRPILRELGNG